jgi:hypothetical protein
MNHSIAETALASDDVCTGELVIGNGRCGAEGRRGREGETRACAKDRDIVSWPGDLVLEIGAAPGHGTNDDTMPLGDGVNESRQPRRYMAGLLFSATASYQAQAAREGDGLQRASRLLSRA